MFKMHENTRVDVTLKLNTSGSNFSKLSFDIYTGKEIYLNSEEITQATFREIRTVYYRKINVDK